MHTVIFVTTLSSEWTDVDRATHSPLFSNILNLHFKVSKKIQNKILELGNVKLYRNTFYNGLHENNQI
jgi:hypothetical protein